MTWGERSGRTAPLPPTWHLLRRAQLERDGFRCVLCGAPASDVDHYGEPDDHTRLRSLCRTCHAKRTSLQGHTARATIRLKKYRPVESHPGEL